MYKTENITLIVETPKGCAQKYNYNQAKHWFELKKAMPAGMVFPFDFGFIPDTKGEDGDPLDVIIISEFITFPGCAICCRIIGAIEAKQVENGNTIRNERFVAIPEISQLYEGISSITELPKNMFEQVEQFFINYNKAFKKEFRPVKRINAVKALKLINQTK